ncbi:sulfate ABC transporter permease subunit [Nocardioides sp. zg-536]|uniref:Sulfate ABC transporter permease subunit n=1 Tax=Nocardioides faecalis TaxID=2803858 RepID=A0A939BWF4_9ACTN|nr:sulfate ABC transporter permease subunit [Nocardioides faecalis]MBM9460976.1 sulfate ABC transporter permease subunit [Nocardioides faecalis]MBS4751967.1 sulfate ABC transporter permease subunit [Nocardioides faecalis]QVI59203.1 sulfate ABC transporter permease subunit [Nocardioides faecalis]
MADTRTTRHRKGPVTYALRIGVIAYLGVLVVWPLYEVGVRTFAPIERGAEGGLAAFWERLQDPTVSYAFSLTATCAFWAVLINTVFGVGISLLLVRYSFPGRRILSVLVDLPMSVSPVVVGLALVLAYSTGQGWFGETLASAGIFIIGSTPGLIMATAFVSLPLVIREIVPVLQEIGTDAELAASSLGANGWQTFRRITLPSIKWAVVYGVVLSMARSLGEFGAVKIVSPGAEYRGETATILIQNRYTNYEEPTAYAAAFVLVLASVLALVVVSLIRKEEHA